MTNKVENPLVDFIFDDNDYVPADSVYAPKPRMHFVQQTIVESPYPCTPRNRKTIKSHRTQIDPQTASNIFEYTIHAKCGEGSYGAVYKASYKQQSIAIKIFKSEGSLHTLPDLTEAIKEHEMLNSSKDLPNVLQLLGWGIDFKGQYFLVTELHTPLARHLSDLSRIQKVFRGFFKGLNALHLNEIVHGDIKPKNLLVNAQGEGVLADLGSATYWDEKRRHDLQTVWYRDPRVFIEAPYDYTIDLWGIGVSLFEVATGQHLFPGCTDEDLPDPTWTRELHTLHLITKFLNAPSKQYIGMGKRSYHYFDATLELRKLPKRFKFPKKGPDFSTLRDVCLSAGQDEPLINHLISLIGRLVTYGEKISPAKALRSPFLAQNNQE